MTVDTRHTLYTCPGPPSDMEMKEAQVPLALPAPEVQAHLSSPQIRAVQPAPHQAPTTIPATTPHGNLTALIESIPAPINIKHIQFTV